MANWIIYLLLFLLPLFIFPFGISEFETPKIFTAEVGIIILLLLSLWQDKIRIKPLLSWPHFSLLILFLLGLFDLIFLQTDLSGLGNAFRLAGVYLLWLLMIFALTSSQFKINLVNKLAVTVFFILSLATVTLGTNLSGRAIGSLGEPNSLAAENLFLWPLSFVFFKNKFLKLTILTLLAVIIFLSGSRSALIGAVVQITFLILAAKAKFSLKKSVLICLILIFLSLILPFFTSYQGLENRSLIWQTGFSAFLNHPIVGVGFGNTEIAIHQQAIKLGNNLQYIYIDSSHNLFLDYALQGGILGLILILTLIITSFSNFIKQGRVLEITLFLGILTCLMFNPLSISILIIFWYLVGQGLISTPD